MVREKREMGKSFFYTFLKNVLQSNKKFGLFLQTFFFAGMAEEKKNINNLTFTVTLDQLNVFLLNIIMNFSKKNRVVYIV